LNYERKEPGGIRVTLNSREGTSQERGGGEGKEHWDGWRGRGKGVEVKCKESRMEEKGEGSEGWLESGKKAYLFSNHNEEEKEGAG